MKQLVICNSSFVDNYERIIASGQFTLNDDLICYALIEKDDISFDPAISKESVLVRKKAFSCNYRETGLIKAVNKVLSSKDEPAYYSIGSEFSGVVVQVGKNVTHFKPGDKVLCDGSYPVTNSPTAKPGLPTNNGSNELEIIHEAKLAHLPDKMDFITGAAFSIGAQTIYSMIEKLGIKENDSVLITGVKSNTAIFAINALRHRGIDIYGLSRNKVDESFFKDLGVKSIFYNNETESLLIDDSHILKHIIEKGRFNHIIDPFGDYYLFRLLDLIEMNGKYITCGIANQTTQKFTQVDLSAFVTKLLLANISIIGNCLGNTDNLLNALTDYSNKKFDILIDSVTNHDVNDFMFKSFLSKERLGKVVFSYL